MGFVVFEESSGRVMKYCKKVGVAKGHCTRHNRELGVGSAWRHNSPWTWCSYQDYEGVLMGMKEPERKMWAFCRG
jgi:hypothetical protein